ncbi:hypothetical protein GUITHDRAFT_144747 [Guillardia theta CCMP2712]|uniref:Uncharacterized protein n=1 Tax=Guillardia theta (strain CCMP2712) TaxID=905079 RepID=L1IPJ8_GUITC|nr:hypothetical protein GUITHDRAFT_144747 [Guillardia theta CCMP2712]EKX37779.1 hypothetical protein GUITHDRAFT_144747 [Guillardia theta CCMP2712]|eukprot:XP_005824759.1 hypothetical protein GUITHDRAFT_144747 [Guillardia theta CCMP2712]
MAGRVLLALVGVSWGVAAGETTNTSNTTTMTIPAGTVMFSDLYCTGDSTFVPADTCLKLGFDEWQGESFYFQCSCKKCQSDQCTTSDCVDCGQYMSGVWFKPPQSWLPMLHCGVYLRNGCGVDSEWPGEACVTTKMEAGRCFNLNSICITGLQNDPTICESPDIIFQNGGKKPCFKSLLTTNFMCPGWDLFG